MVVVAVGILTFLIIMVVLFLDAFNFPSHINNQLDFHNIGYYFEAIITGLITLGAMLFVDYLNAKRFKKEASYRFMNKIALDFYQILNDFCENVARHLQDNQEKVDEINTFAKDNELILRCFLKQPDINVLKSVHLLLDLYTDNEGTTDSTKLNRNFFEEIKLIRNRLYESIFKY